MHHYRYRTYYRSVNSSWRRRRRSSPKQKIFFGLLVFAIFSFVKVWQKTNVDYQHRRNDQLQAELQQLRGENALMEAQIEELRAAGRLTAIATEKLHLTFVPKINLQEKTAFEKLTARLDRLQK